MIEILFLLGFTLHNIEEAIWLPEWSKSAGSFHRKVSADEFLFAVIIVTALGYLFAFQYFVFGQTSRISKYLFTGFVLMMVLNTFFPHLIATIAAKKYAPGLITGLLLNVPLGIYFLTKTIHGKTEILYLVLFTIVITAFTLGLISIMFKAAKKLFGWTNLKGNGND